MAENKMSEPAMRLVDLIKEQRLLLDRLGRLGRIPLAGAVPLADCTVIRGDTREVEAQSAPKPRAPQASHTSSQWPATTITRPPGALLIRLLEILYPRKSRERVFDPIIFDMRLEHAEALSADRPKFARWVHIRGIGILILAMAFYLFSSVGQAALKIWSASK